MCCSSGSKNWSLNTTVGHETKGSWDDKLNFINICMLHPILVGVTSKHFYFMGQKV